LKKNYIAIGLMCTLVAALGLGLYFLREEVAQPELGGPAPVTYLFRYTRPPLSVRLEGPGQEPYTLARLGYDPERNLVTDATIPEMEGLPLDDARVNAVISASRSLTYLELVGDDINDLNPFGLAEPRGRASLDFEELGVRTILIGGVAPGNVGVYIQLEGDTAVYLTPIHGMDNFLLSPLDYLDMNVTPLMSWPPNFDSMALSGQVREHAGEILILAAGEGEYRLTAPLEHELSPIYAPGVIHSGFGIVAAGVAMTHPATEDLEMLGLYPAWSTLTVEGGERGGFTLHSSQPDEGSVVFLHREGVPVVYMASGHDMPWLDIQFYQLMNPFVPAPILEELARLQVTVLEPEGGSIYHFRSGALEAEGFREFYTELISTVLEFPRQPAGPGERVIIVNFTPRGGEASSVYFFTSEVPLRHYVRVDDGPVFLTPSLHIEQVLAQADELADEVLTFVGRPDLWIIDQLDTMN